MSKIPYRIGHTKHEDGTFGVVVIIGGFTEDEAKLAAKNVERWIEEDDGLETLVRIGKEED